MRLHVRLHVRLYLVLPQVSSACMRLVSLPMWYGLSPPRLSLELQQSPPLRRHWQHLQVVATLVRAMILRLLSVGRVVQGQNARVRGDARDERYYENILGIEPMQWLFLLRSIRLLLFSSSSSSWCLLQRRLLKQRAAQKLVRNRLLLLLLRKANGRAQTRIKKRAATTT